MTTKYINLWSDFGLKSISIPFKWEWRVSFEKKVFSNRRNKWSWEPREIIHQNRAMARFYARSYKSDPYLQNVKIQRRLVAAHWTDYNDSFSYSEKGNGNGR